MKTLANKRITGSELLNWTGDCGIEFESRYTLRLFCDQQGGNEPMDNYSIRIPGKWITVGYGGSVVLDDSEIGRP